VLNLVSSRTIVDLSERLEDLDQELLNDVLTTHASHVKVLLGPPNPQDGELITSDHLRPILEALRHEFDYVVVDTQSSFHDRALAVLDMADRIVVLMTLEMTCIKNIKLFMEVADLLEYPREKMMLVLNKADNRLGIRVENVENNIHHKVMLQIANAPYEMTLSVNQGVPLVIGRRDHRASKDLFALARELSRPGGETATEVQAVGAKPVQKASTGRGFLGRLFSQR
jgi:pilus assembly protein CpaE